MSYYTPTWGRHPAGKPASERAFFSRQWKSRKDPARLTIRAPQQTPQRIVRNPLRPRLKIESLHRHPPAIIESPQRLQHGPEIVISRPGMPAVHLVHMDMPNHIEMPHNQRRMRLRLIHRIMRIEHGPDPGTADLAHDPRSLVE